MSLDLTPEGIDRAVEAVDRAITILTGYGHDLTAKGLPWPDDLRALLEAEARRNLAPVGGYDEAVTALDAELLVAANLVAFARIEADQEVNKGGYWLSDHNASMNEAVRRYEAARTAKETASLLPAAGAREPNAAELKELLGWAMEQYEESHGGGSDETPEHHCGYEHAPDTGYCKFHDKYWRIREILGTIPEGDEE